MDERMEREYRDALDGLRFSDGAKERMMKNLTEQKEERPMKRWNIRPLRAALIAACLCLVLVGTAFAGLEGVKGLRLAHLEPHIDGKGRFDGYTVSGDLETYPLRSFSDAFHEAAKTRTGRVDMEFADFEEVQAYLGADIPCSWPSGWDGTFIVSLYHNEDGDIWGSDVISWDQSGCTNVRMRVLTEKSHGAGQQESILGLYGGGPDAEMVRLDSYLMPNGCVAETFTISETVDTTDYCSCNSFFIADGNIYEIYTWDTQDNQAELWPRIQAVLDSFT